MNTKEFNESISKIDVAEKTKEGILELIDLKSKSNIEPILKEMRSEFKIIQQKSDSVFKRLEDKIEIKTTILTCGMGIIMGLIGGLIIILVASKFIH